MTTLSALRIRTKILLLVLLNVIALATIVIMIGTVFDKAERLTAEVAGTETKHVIDNSHLTRALSSFFSDVDVFNHAFLGDDQVLETTGQRLSATLDRIAARADDPELKKILATLNGQYADYLAVCGKVNQLIAAQKAAMRESTHELTALEHLLSRQLIDVTLKGSDPSHIDQILALTTGYRESLLVIEKLQAETWAAFLKKDPERTREDIIGVLDDLYLRLQTITASAPDIAAHGVRISEFVARHKEATKTLIGALVDLNSHLDGLDASRARVSDVITLLDRDSAHRSGTLGSQIASIFKQSRLALILFSISVILLIGAISVVVVGRYITDPLKNLVSRINSLSSDHYKDSHPSGISSVESEDIGTGDEVQIISEAFNSMENRVAERTSSLKREIAEKEKAQRSLEAAKAEAEIANAAKTRFLAAASHDLRQPVHAISLLTGVLARKDLPPEAQAVVRNMEHNLESFESLLGALLDISRLDAGALKPELHVFPVQQLLEKMAAEFSQEAREKGLALRVATSSANVRSDWNMLTQIARNLVANAIRYTKTGKILLGARRRGTHLRIEIWDTGVGIPPEETEKVFHEFHQIGNPERDRGRGLGLGLAIVKRLAILLGHAVQVTSRPGTGSMFAIEVPIGPDTVSEDIPSSVPDINTSVLEGVRVVVVEDDRQAREATCALLNSWGCQVVAGESTKEVLRRLPASENAKTCIVADFRLRGDETGVHAIDTIRKVMNKEVPAILITGDTAPERLQEATRSGHKLIHKPLRPARLLTLVRNMVDSRASA